MNKEEIEEWVRQNDRQRSHVITICTDIDHQIGNLLSSRFTFTFKDKSKFHKIFFESKFVSFDTKIAMFQNFLNLYEKEWFSKTEIANIFKLLGTFQKIRNKFAHCMEPTFSELTDTPKIKMPYCLIYQYEDAMMKGFERSEKQMKTFDKEMEKLKMLLLVVDTKILNHKDELLKLIKSGKA